MKISTRKLLALTGGMISMFAGGAMPPPPAQNFTPLYSFTGQGLGPYLESG